MMATTHVFAALAVVAPVAYAVPELATPLALGAILGGLAPDFDFLFEHRRTFHVPVLGGPAATIFVGTALFVPTAMTAALAAFAVSAWLHSLSDALGGGPEMDPWHDPGDRAVYDRFHGRWIRPRRWVRYDGAPEDAALALALAIPGLFVFDAPITGVIVGGLVVSFGYAAVRRRLVEWTPGWLE